MAFRIREGNIKSKQGKTKVQITIGQSERKE